MARQPTKTTCPACGGRKGGMTTCSRCGGHQTVKVCPNCKGKGKVGLTGLTCSDCGGSGAA